MQAQSEAPFQESSSEHSQEPFDVLIIGAGLSGVGTACRLKRECPHKRIAIIDRRERMGGTWDLFRYPGIRSDSDMFSFGFEWRPWGGYQVLADGPGIRQYVQDTAAEYDVEKDAQFGLKVERGNWDRNEQLWTLHATHEPSGEARTLKTKVLILCTGYYNYDQGHAPEFAGADAFEAAGGKIVHPQFWPEDLDYAGKKMVVIGSGATAVTIVPAVADDVAHVTMLQRSPSYIFAIPAFDKITKWMDKILPWKWVFAFARWRNILLQRWIYKAARRWPNKVRKLLLGGVRKQLDDESQMKHFTPSYDPWDQRLCAVPDGDLFKAINAGKASVVTDHIERFDAAGIQLKSGEHIDADVIVTATGLEIQMMGGMNLTVDGQEQPVNQTMTYKSVLVEGAPNIAYVFGYTNAPWTLKADLAGSYISRLIQHMDAHGYSTFCPVAPEGTRTTENVMESMSSGYIQRAKDRIPVQGKTAPWQVTHHLESDRVMLLKDPIDDGILQFGKAPAEAAEPDVRHAA